MNGLTYYSMYEKRFLYPIVLSVTVLCSMTMFIHYMPPQFSFSLSMISVACINFIVNQKMRSCNWHSYAVSMNISKKELLRSNIVSYGIDTILAMLLSFILCMAFAIAGPNDYDVAYMFSCAVVPAAAIIGMMFIQVSLVQWLRNNIVRTSIAFIFLIAAFMMTFGLMPNVFDITDALCVLAASVAVMALAYISGQKVSMGADL